MDGWVMPVGCLFDSCPPAPNRGKVPIGFGGEPNQPHSRWRNGFLSPPSLTHLLTLSLPLDPLTIRPVCGLAGEPRGGKKKMQKKQCSRGAVAQKPKRETGEKGTRNVDVAAKLGAALGLARGLVQPSPAEKKTVRSNRCTGGRELVPFLVQGGVHFAYRIVPGR